MIDLSMFHKIQAIVFDLDGVLVDSRPLHYEALNRALAEIDKKFVINVEEHLAKYDGLPTSKKLLLLSEEKGLPRGFHTEIWKRKQDMTFDLIKEIVKPCEKLRNMLSSLRKSGFKLYCCSNSISLTLNEMLKSLGVLEFFERVYSNEDVISSKPHPMIYLRCCCDNGYAPCQVIVVEDSPIGRVSATLSGCHVCAVASPDSLSLDVVQRHITIAEAKNKAMTIDTRWNSDVQVVIPMAGLGSRFANAGWKNPKPLINVSAIGQTKPMIQMVVENLNVPGAQFTFIVRQEHLDSQEWNLKQRLENITPGCNVVCVDKVTQGPACSVLLAWEAGVLNPDKPLLIANSDQWLEWDPNAFLYQSQSADGCISVFIQPDPNDKKWSYALVDDNGWVTQVKEKEVISDLATTGVYYWNKTRDFVKYATSMIEADDRVNGEFYVAPIYNYAISDGKRIKVVKCKKMWGLGVPEDLAIFEHHKQF